MRPRSRPHLSIPHRTAHGAPRLPDSIRPLQGTILRATPAALVVLLLGTALHTAHASSSSDAGTPPGSAGAPRSAQASAAGDGGSAAHPDDHAPLPTADEVEIPQFLGGDAPEIPKGYTLRHPAEVQLRVTVATDGHIRDVTVQRSAGKALDQAAIQAVMTWRFRPAHFHGHPIEVQSDIPLVFMPPGETGSQGPTVLVKSVDAPDGGAVLTHEDQDDDEGDGHVHVHDGHVHEHEGHEHPHLVVQTDGSGSTDGGVPPTSSEPPVRETVVRASALPPPSVAASDFRIQVGRLADVPRRSASELMTLAPGVMLANHGGQGHADSIFLRGFAAGEGKDVELRLNGIPLNEISNAHSHGYAQTYFIIPELVEGLRVVEGPFDATQGDFAVAGTVEYELGLRRRGITLGGGLGSYGESRATVLWGPKEADQDTFVGFLFRNGDGYGLNRAFTNATLMAQTRLELSERTRLTLFGTFYAGRFGSAGVIREYDLVAGTLPCAEGEFSQFFCSYDPSQGGAEQRGLASARLTQRFEDGGRMETQLSFVTRQLRLRTNYTGFTYDLPPEGEAQRGDLTEQSYGGQTFTLQGRYEPQVTLWNQPRAVELGYFARVDDVETRSRRLRDRGGAPYATLFDSDVRAGNLAAWAKAAVRPVPQLVLRGGLRLETFGFSVLDHNRPTLDRQGTRLPDEEIEAYGFFAAPRGSAEWLFTEHWSLLAAGGLGARSSDATALSDAEFAPFAKVTAGELGTRYAREWERLSVETRAGVFATHVSQDLVFDELQGRNIPVGASNRLGVFGSARASWAHALDAQVSGAYTRASLPGAETGLGSLLGGTALPYVPRLLLRGDASWRGTLAAFDQQLGWAFSLGSSYIGPKPLPLGRFSEPIFLMDAGARLTWKGLEFGLELQNLLDARWREAEYNYVSNFRGAEAAPSLLSTRHFSAGAPRQLRGTLTVHFD